MLTSSPLIVCRKSTFIIGEERLHDLFNLSSLFSWESVAWYPLDCARGLARPFAIELSDHIRLHSSRSIRSPVTQHKVRQSAPGARLRRSATPSRADRALVRQCNRFGAGEMPNPMVERALWW